MCVVLLCVKDDLTVINDHLIKLRNIIILMRIRGLREKEPIQI